MTPTRCLLLALAGASVASTPACLDTDDAGPEVADVEQAATFDWGGDCSSGSGTFTDSIARNAIESIGVIPDGKRDVTIALTSAADVDVQLVDRATGTKIIAWPDGLLHGAGAACTTYRDVEYCYSGYDGVGGQPGHETIAIHGDTNTDLEMRAYGYAAGDAVVDYAWQPVPTCNEQGDGSFSASLARDQVEPIGTIPAGKVGVLVRLTADQDLDIQLFDGEVALVRWPDGMLSGSGQQTLEHAGMTITWSGYNGDGTGLGHEYIRIDGLVTADLTMKAFAYQAGTARVTYAWGTGTGVVCGGRTDPPNPPCGADLSCKNVVPDGLARDATGECHTESWCLSDEMAADNCANLMHVAVPGRWGCEEFTCTWVSDDGAATCSLFDQTCPAGYTCEIGCPDAQNCGINPPGTCVEIVCPAPGDICSAVCGGHPINIPDGCPLPGCMCPDPELP